MDKKILYTTSSEDIINSIANICCCSVENINNYLSESEHLIDKNIEEIDLDSFFRSIGIEFSSRKELFEIVKFDSIVISHLTTRINKPDESDIYYLNKALVEPTELSVFLESKGLAFNKLAYMIITYYNNEIIDWNKFKDSRASRIKVRLSENKKRSDNCINGFLINDYFWKDSNVTHIKNVPEIVDDICTVIKRQDIVEEWKRQSKPYALGFIADIKDIIFDNNVNIKTIKSKIYLTYRYLIRYLIKIQNDKFNSRFDNIIVRLKDNLSVDKENIIGFYEIED